MLRPLNPKPHPRPPKPCFLGSATGRTVMAPGPFLAAAKKCRL